MRNKRLTQRLDRIAAAMPPAPPADTDPALGLTTDARDLASELAGVFHRFVRQYRELYNVSEDEARARASEKSPDVVQTAMDRPPDQTSWFDLDSLASHSTDAALAKWGQIKDAARDELLDGFRASRLLEGDQWSAWERAQFIAMLRELIDGWKPRDGLEFQLVVQLAQFQALLNGWQQILALWMSLTTQGMRQARKAGTQYEQTRLSDAESVERAACMVERFHRLYVSTLRALQTQRRLGPAVVVRRAGQVNIGNHQVNVAR